MYNTLLQTVLLYGSESWVATDVMVMMLEGFHNRMDKLLKLSSISLMSLLNNEPTIVGLNYIY